MPVQGSSRHEEQGEQVRAGGGTRPIDKTCLTGYIEQFVIPYTYTESHSHDSETSVLQ